MILTNKAEEQIQDVPEKIDKCHGINAMIPASRLVFQQLLSFYGPLQPHGTIHLFIVHDA